MGIFQLVGDGVKFILPRPQLQIQEYSDDLWKKKNQQKN